MNPRLAEIAPRLKSLLLMLTSDRDGEVVAAARAVTRTLKSAGADWHDLAGLLTAAPSSTRNRHDDNGDDWRGMRNYCAEHGGQLSLREWDFIGDIEHWRGNLTEKQLAWLSSIYARLRRAA